MRRRILLACVGLTIVTVVSFAVPLAIVVGDRQAEQDRRELTILAARAADRVPAGVKEVDPSVFPRGEAGQALGLYGMDGRRRAGRGPAVLEASAGVAAQDRIADVLTDTHRVVTVPVVEGEQVVAMIRAAEPLRDGAARVHQTWLLVGAVGLLVLAIAGAIALVVARRLSKPLEDLRDDAHRIGEGDFTVTPRQSGIREIDEVGTTLASTAGRIGDLLTREQAFSTDASHQLRTPLTGLRLTLENELAMPRPDPHLAIEEALTDVERLEATVSGLLALAREVMPADRTPLDLREVLRSCAPRWRRQARASDRELLVHVGGAPIVVRFSWVALEHVLDVLVDNSLRHGSGRVEVRASSRGDLAVVVCADQGPRPASGPDLFARRSDNAAGNGIGLALARRLTESEGGRLQLSPRAEQTSFEVLIPTSDSSSNRRG